MLSNYPCSPFFCQLADDLKELREWLWLQTHDLHDYEVLGDTIKEVMEKMMLKADHPTDEEE